MRLEPWYVGVIAAWLVLGLPSILIGIGFAGGHPFRDLDFSQFSALGIILWFVTGSLLLAPLWLAPFGLKRKKSQADDSN